MTVVSILSITLCAIIIFGAKSLGRQAGRQSARIELAEQCKANNAPLGFGGARWLMSEAEVRSLFPPADQHVAHTLVLGHYRYDIIKVEATAWGRFAFIDFAFHKDRLQQVIITFKGEKTESTYRSTQAILSSQYGPFSDASRTENYILMSKKRTGPIAIEHNLYEALGIPIEQVMLYIEHPGHL